MQPILPSLDNLIQTRADDIRNWMRERFMDAPAHIYNSVDLRHSGLKLAPVDTNLFPAGFNNLSRSATVRAVRRMKEFFADMPAPPTKILLIPENHTRNLFYLDNLAALKSILEQSGVQVMIGSLIAGNEPLQLTSQNGSSLTLYPLVKKEHLLTIGSDFEPDLILLNNDLTGGIPPLLVGLSEIPLIVPPLSMGWYQRRKSTHFAAFEQVAKDFASSFNLDPWLISASFHQCGMVNFREQTGLECVAHGVDRVLHTVRYKYKDYGITEEPYVFVKSDSGTYGMGIMTVRSGDELLDLNKKTRNKMDVIKEGVQNTEVIIQEGIPTIDRIENAPAEPMVYLVNGCPVGGAWRINEQRDALNNLNAPGMRFVGMCDQSECGEEQSKAPIEECQYNPYGLIARLAALASAQEHYSSDQSLVSKEAAAG